MKNLIPLKMNQDKYLYVGCMPVEDCPEHPTDQSACVQIECPHCNQLMWFSEKKRKIQEKSPEEVRVYCLECLAIGIHNQGLEPELVDVGKVI